MKKNSTMKKIACAMMLAMLFSTASLQAQLTFEVTSPAGVAGQYEMAAAQFGGEFPDVCNGIPAINGEVIIADDGDDEGGTQSTTDACQDLVNDLTGKIALIDRGNCEFGSKSLKAEAAGAIAVIVCNNTADPIVAMPGGVDGGSVTIPALMLSMADCATIRAEIPTVEVSIYYQNDPGTDVVLWGAATGEGDFNGGLNGWTTVNDGNCPGVDLWVWSADGTATGGAFSTGGGVSESPTACNGAMAFDSDFYDNGGDGNNQGGGICPADQVGELISPTIDLSTVAAGAAGISVKFHQALREYTSTYYVSYSNDDGATWIDVEINSELEVNSAHINEWKRVLLSEADLNTTTFKLKFRWEANYYYWIIDNVQLIEPEAHNLTVMSNFYAIAPNAVTPASQVEPFSFLADVYNAGALTQDNVNLNVTIDDNSTEVFSGDLGFGSIPGDSLVENEPFTVYFTPDGSINEYEGTYEITSDSSALDFNPDDNFQYFSFLTSDTTFAKETGMTRTIFPAASNWEGVGEVHSWAYGNFYHVVNGDDWHASSATFGLGNASDIPGTLLTIYLYKWDEDTNEDGNMDPSERTRIGFSFYEIIGNEATTDLITVPLSNFPSGSPGPIDIESGQSYVLMVEYEANDDVTDMVLVASDVMDYSAMAFRSELDGIPEGYARYAGMLGVNGDLTSEPYSSVGFGMDLVPVVRLNLATPVSTKTPLDAANILEVSPNPAKNKISLKVDLVETHENVSVRIFDVNGRLILDQPYEDVSSTTLNFDVSAYTSGAYFLHFITENGVRTERFIVQH